MQHHLDYEIVITAYETLYLQKYLKLKNSFLIPVVKPRDATLNPHNIFLLLLFFI